MEGASSEQTNRMQNRLDSTPAVRVRTKSLLASFLFLLWGCSGGGSGASAPPASSPPPTGGVPSAPNPPDPPDQTNDPIALAALSITAVVLDQPFEANRTSYNAGVGYLQNVVHIDVEPSVADAVVRINGELADSANRNTVHLVTAAGVETCIFDRGGYRYHGRVADLAEGAREGGLQF